MIVRGRLTAMAVAVVFAVSMAPLVPRADAGERPGAEAGSSDWRQLSAGDGFTCGIRASGRLFCWGDDMFGQLGNGGANIDTSVPTQVAGGHTDWTAVSTGGSFACGRRSTGRLYCWGNDNGGQLGNGAPNVGSPVPVEVAGNVTTWASVTSGSSHSCARRTSGRLFCWGSDASGQLGNGEPNAAVPAPVQVAGGRTDWTAVSAGSSHSCARRTSGGLFCWGRDLEGQVGDGGANVFARSSPVQVLGNVTTWASVAAGGAHTCARRTSGRLFCWGDDSDGQLGDGGINSGAATPVQVAGNVTTWTSVTVGLTHSCARRTSGRLYCWGGDDLGQLGDAGPNVFKTTPTEVWGGATDWLAVDAGDFQTCARIASRRAYCWGWDGQGQLGDGPPLANQSEPSEVGA